MISLLISFVLLWMYVLGWGSVSLTEDQSIVIIVAFVLEVIVEAAAIDCYILSRQKRTKNGSGNIE